MIDVIVDGHDDFAAFASGEVLVARATAPAWPRCLPALPPWSLMAALAAHASLIKRE